jgi:hypothetical protein
MTEDFSWAGPLASDAWFGYQVAMCARRGSSTRPRSG